MLFQMYVKTGIYLKILYLKIISCLQEKKMYILGFISMLEFSLYSKDKQGVEKVSGIINEVQGDD